MEKKLFAGFMLIVSLTTSLALMFNPGLVRASETIVVPDDYPTIQEAIDAASPGDTVIVSEGTYPEGTIVVDKSLTMLANGSVIVDGLQRGYVFFVFGWRGGVTIKGFTITNSGRLFIDSGIFLLGASNCRIEGNTIINSKVGIWVEDSLKSNVISNNVITNNDRWGISLETSSNVSIVNNTITKNNGGGFLLLYSNGNTISNNDLTAGLSRQNRLIYSNNNTISGNTITNNGYGIELEDSMYNSIVGNTIKNNYYGVYLEKSDGNSIHHNNFINNKKNQAYMLASNNTWDSDYPSGGNYWSDYLGVDEKSGMYQNETGSDGIGDTPYTIDVYNQDNYPLIKPYPWDPHDLGITRVTSKTVIGQGFTVNVSITIFNYGTYTETFNVTAYADTTIIDTFTGITLTSRNSTIITFSWNTTGFIKGNHNVSIYVQPVLGEIDTTDNTYSYEICVTILGDVDGDFDVDIYDVVKITSIYGSKRGDPQFNPNGDLDCNGEIQIYDLVRCTSHYGDKDP